MSKAKTDFHIIYTRTIIALVVMLLAIILSGCDQSNAADASAAVEAYYKAMVDKDRDEFISLFCAEWEAQALTDFDAFGAVDASLEGFSCEEIEAAEDSATVSCKGGILVVYGDDDNRLFDLDEYTYQVSKEDGEWQMCGHD